MAYMEIREDLWTDFEGNVGDRGLLKLFSLSIVLCANVYAYF